MEYIGQGQSFQRRRRSKRKGQRIIVCGCEWQAYWFICLICVQLVLGEVREEWGVESAGMVKTYMHIPGACLLWGILFLDISQDSSRVQGFVGRDLE
jgi:hypothetical protein